MILTRLLAIVAVSYVMAGASTINNDTRQPLIQGPRQAQPASYDYSIRWIYNPAIGSTELWGYTPNAGGIYELITFTSETSYWKSITSSFYNSEFTFEIRIYKSTLNNGLFTQIGTTNQYRYSNNYMGYFGAYVANSDTAWRLYVSVASSSYYVTYMRSRDTTISYTNVVDYYQTTYTTTRVYTQATDTTYSYVATYAVASKIADAKQTNDTAIFNTDGFYFDVVSALNLEDEEITEYINQGYIEGYDDGKATGSSEGYIEGYNDGVVAGMDDEGWADVFGIFDQAVAVVDNVFSISLFGPFTIGVLVAIPIIMGLLFWIVDKWRGA